jgi:hypothetical protein
MLKNNQYVWRIEYNFDRLQYQVEKCKIIDSITKTYIVINSAQIIRFYKEDTEFYLFDYEAENALKKVKELQLKMLGLEKQINAIVNNNSQKILCD